MDKIKQKILKILFLYKTLSILKKLLLAPLIGIIFVFPFYFFIFLGMLDMKSSVESVNSKLIPIYEMSHENILLLENIANEMNGAVLAKEADWLEISNKSAEAIKKNLSRYKGGDYEKDIQNSIKAFDEYFSTIKKISKKKIENNHNYKGIEQDTKVLIKNYNSVSDLFRNLKSKTKNEIEKNFNSLYENTNNIISSGNKIFFTWVLTSAIIIILVYKDIGYRINEIVKSSKDIAKGDVDFEKRLCSVSYDELGQIVRSINIFINKLHKSHEELSLAKRELDALYITDRLTGVYNRIKIDEIIDIELKNKKNRSDETFSVILIDIDYFKAVNDTYGHLVGDEILKEFAAILKENIRESDFIGRWGGEEFIIVCSKTDQKGAISLAENLKSKIEQFEFKKVGKKTASFGIATCVDDNITSIIDNADKALYSAKNKGRNQVVCYN